MTKLWNLSRFISSFPQVKTAKLQPSDKWILSELTLLIQKSMKGYRDYNFFVPSTAIRDFVWETFASHYLEMVKPRAYGEGFTKSSAESCMVHAPHGLEEHTPSTCTHRPVHARARLEAIVLEKKHPRPAIPKAGVVESIETLYPEDVRLQPRSLED